MTFSLENPEPHRSSVTIPPHWNDTITRFLAPIRSERDLEEIDSEQARLLREVSVVHETAKRGVESDIASPPKDHDSCIGMGASTLSVQLRFPHTGAEQFHASAGAREVCRCLHRIPRCQLLQFRGACFCASGVDEGRTDSMRGDQFVRRSQASLPPNPARNEGMDSCANETYDGADTNNPGTWGHG
ncbi:hypothetical protein [Burkholderia ubonensis]|uniref:hypothetical protein n=1 Tax=Burkholderia ubonensis TaxID=101571 RepID=UPI000AC2D706|nr:hypothetical protein [Burkholderia ubonensis]